eukprot:scaffold1651_cov52-Phaeocystis_antarctica.AAC.2
MFLRPAGKSGRCSRANWWKGFVNAPVELLLEELEQGKQCAWKTSWRKNPPCPYPCTRKRDAVLCPAVELYCNTTVKYPGPRGKHADDAEASQSKFYARIGNRDARSSPQSPHSHRK